MPSSNNWAITSARTHYGSDIDFLVLSRVRVCVRARVCLLAHAHPLCCGGKQFMCKLSMLSIWWAQEISHNPQVTPSDQLILIHIWLCIYRVGCCV